MLDRCTVELGLAAAAVIDGLATNASGILGRDLADLLLHS
jgi:hypothetical protein